MCMLGTKLLLQYLMTKVVVAAQTLRDNLVTPGGAGGRKRPGEGRSHLCFVWPVPCILGQGVIH